MSKNPQQKIILYYKFVLVSDPHMTMMWQRVLCEQLRLQGRIIISEHGINGTLGGTIDDLRAYKRAMKLSKTFDDIAYKWSDGTREDFPKLSIKVRKELVTLAPKADFDVFDSGHALTPRQWHEALLENPDAIIIDARNDYESGIGKFKGAVTPPIKAFRDIKDSLDSLPKDQPVYTYCTGDIRCEYLSAYMKSEGFQDVYHLDGGIVKYGQEFGDDGLWDGNCYVFDKRRSIAFSESASAIGECSTCGDNTSSQIDCANQFCGEQLIRCQRCSRSNLFCVTHTA